jgi:hypothetical protein
MSQDLISKIITKRKLGIRQMRLLLSMPLTPRKMRNLTQSKAFKHRRQSLIAVNLKKFGIE